MRICPCTLTKPTLPPPEGRAIAFGDAVAFLPLSFIFFFPAESGIRGPKRVHSSPLDSPPCAGNEPRG